MKKKKTGTCGTPSSETPFPKSEYKVENWFCRKLYSHFKHRLGIQGPLTTLI